MNKIQHPSNNGVLGAPAGWDQAELPCGALPITRTHVGDLPAVVSYWRPSVEELAVLNSGGLSPVIFDTFARDLLNVVSHAPSMLKLTGGMVAPGTQSAI